MGLLLSLLFIVAAGALLWWGFSRMPLPEPVKTILLVVVGLVLLLFLLWNAVGGHPYQPTLIPLPWVREARTARATLSSGH